MNPSINVKKTLLPQMDPDLFHSVGDVDAAEWRALAKKLARWSRQCRKAAAAMQAPPRLPRVLRRKYVWN
jgi:hypothetical protein